MAASNDVEIVLVAEGLRVHEGLRFWIVLDWRSAGSNAKMATMFKGLIREGIPAEKLERIRTPIGIPIHSRTPEEIAVSIAAEIISVKNSM